MLGQELQPSANCCMDYRRRPRVRPSAGVFAAPNPSVDPLTLNKMRAETETRTKIAACRVSNSHSSSKHEQKFFDLRGAKVKRLNPTALNSPDY